MQKERSMSNLILLKESSRYPGLFIKKYNKRVFFDNLWNTDPALVEARGHVVTSDGTRVINPFTKVFNFGENGTTINRDSQVLSIRKVNGFMCGVTYIPCIDEVVTSTTGSLDSMFVDYANEYITPKIREFIKQHAIEHEPCTWLFEIVHPSDPHIVPEIPGPYLLGARAVASDEPYTTSVQNESYLDQVALEIGVMRPEFTVEQFDHVVQLGKTVKHEGFVVYDLTSSTVLKIKSRFYLVNKMFARKKDVLSLDRSRVDEEFYPLLDHIAQIASEFNSMSEQERLEYTRNWIENNLGF